MNATQARQVLLLRACESEAPAEPAADPADKPALWTAADSAWADSQALRLIGEQASAEQFLSQRASLGVERIAQREPALAVLLRPDASSSAWAIGALVMLALLVGLATDAVGPAGQINLLAPPLLAVMVWNILVYLAILVEAARKAISKGNRNEPGGWLQRSASGVAARFSRRPATARSASATARRFASDWSHASQPLQLARLATLLHWAALAVAAGALLAIYTRGLAFEYRAGWDSTFLSAEGVHRWLNTILRPALAITGQALPDPAQLEGLRFSLGGGENAARWIHWYAITTGLVMLPRVLLAALAMRRSRRLQADLPLPLSERYFQRLLQGFAHLRNQTAQLAVVAPYSYQSATERRPALAAAIDEAFGPGLQLKVLSNVAMGTEDDLPDDWPQAELAEGVVHCLLPLFALSATPERETHGAYVRAALSRAASMPGHPQCRVMIDESGFRQRQSDVDLSRRIDDRRAAWQKLLDDESAGAALFVDLGTAEPTKP